MGNITQEEMNERVAVLKKFKSLLEKQRNKFKEYLTVLEKQEGSIINEDAESLLAHTELEEEVVKNIMNLKKVIVPMNELYQKLNSSTDNCEIIQNELQDLEKKVLKQNEKNRDLLKTHITEIKHQLAGIKNPYKHNRSIYAEKKPIGKFLEIKA